MAALKQVDQVLLVSIRTGIALILLTPLMVTGVFPFLGGDTLFPFVIGKAIYSRVLIEIIFAAWLILAMRNTSYRLPHSRVLWLFGIWVLISLFAAYAGVSFQKSFWSDYRRMGGVFDLMHWLTFAIMVVSVLKNRNHWFWILNVSLGAGLMVALLGLAQHFQFQPVISTLWYLQEADRIDGTFGNPTYVGVYLLVTIFIGLALIAQSFMGSSQPSRSPSRQARGRQRIRNEPSIDWIPLLRVFWAVAVVLGFWVLTLSGSRGAAIGVAAGLVFVAAGYALWGQRRVWRVVAGGLVVAALALALVMPLLIRSAPFQGLADRNVLAKRIDSTLSSGIGESYDSRYLTASTGLQAFRDAPILGWGPENFAITFDQYVEPGQLRKGKTLADQAHNQFIEELTTKGILGFTAYTLLIGWVVWTIARAVRRESDDQLFVLFMGAAFAGYMVQNLVLFDTPGTFLLFVLLVGWAARREKQISVLNPGLDSVEGDSGSRRSRHQAARRNVLTTRESRIGVKLKGYGVNPTAVVNVAIVLCVVLASLSIYYFNYRPYRAAQVFPLRGTSIETFMAQAQTSFKAFPPLATLGRQVMLDTIILNWDHASNETQSLILQQMRIEGEAAARSEPHNARLYLSLARLFQQASRSDDTYLPVARVFVDRADKFAPGLPQTITAIVDQKAAEGDYAGALAMIWAYIPTPVVYEQLYPTMLEVREKLIEEIGWGEFNCRWYEKYELTLEERAALECGY